MTKEKYNALLKEAEQEHEKKVKEIYRQYAIANNSNQIGDLITDHIGMGKITKISFYKSYGMPECCYTCYNLNKNGQINKKEPIRIIYQSNIIKP